MYRWWSCHRRFSFHDRKRRGQDHERYNPRMRMVAMFLGLATLAGAHDVSRSDSKVEIQGKEVRVFLTLNYKELQNPAFASEDVQSIFAAVQQHYFVGDPAA